MKCDRSYIVQCWKTLCLVLASQQTPYDVGPPKMQLLNVNFSLDFLSAQRDRANKLQILNFMGILLKNSQQSIGQGKNWVFFMIAIIC